MPASPALSQLNTATDSIATRKIAVLATDGVDAEGVGLLKRSLEARRDRGGTGAGRGRAWSPGTRRRSARSTGPSDHRVGAVRRGGRAVRTRDSVDTLSKDGYAMHFITEAYKHLKAVGAFGSGVDLLRNIGIDEQLADDTAVVVSNRPCPLRRPPMTSPTSFEARPRQVGETPCMGTRDRPCACLTTEPRPLPREGGGTHQ